MGRWRRDDGGRSLGSAVLVVLLAVGLIAGPVWVEVLHLDDREYRYERVEVTAGDGTIEYAPDANHPAVPISEDVACSGLVVARSCYLERGLIGNGSVPTSMYTSGDDPPSVESTYRFVAGPEAVYRVETVLDRSQGYVVENGSVRPVDEDADPDGPVRYRVELTLERVPAATALERVSVDVDDVDPPVREAARTGSVRTYRAVDVPATPVKLADGSYYRVHRAAERGPTETERRTAVLLRYLAPAAGLLLGYRGLKGLSRDRAG